ncbi:MAG: hypothetical protein ACREQI_16640, partial [Candidatus Binataceae bacterium]
RPSRASPLPPQPTTVTYLSTSVRSEKRSFFRTLLVLRRSVAGWAPDYFSLSEAERGYFKAFIPAIYGWNRTVYANISKEKRFTPFYRQKVESLRREIAANPYKIEIATWNAGKFISTTHTGYDPRKIEVAAIESLIGARSEATLNWAVNAAKSQDPYAQGMAVALFRQIAGWGGNYATEATRHLKFLAADSNSGVALAAKMDLASANERTAKTKPPAQPHQFHQFLNGAIVSPP